MSETAAKECSLRVLLDRFVDAQRRDIQLYSSGHLNESRLYRSPDVAPCAKWVTNRPSVPPARPADKTEERDVERMKDSLLRFTLGTSGLSFPKGRYVNRSESPMNPDVTTTASLSDVQLETPRCLSSSSLCSRPVSWNSVQSNYQTSELNVIPSHLEAITMKDRYKKMKEYELNVLRPPEVNQRQILTGSHAVEFLEKRLQQNLKELNASVNDDGPSFQRLQIYQDVFQDLIDSSPTFHYVLQQIKSAYDGHMSSLIDDQSAGHSTLQADIVRLRSVNHSVTGPKLESEIERVRTLEQQARQLLEENERLRKELAKEQEFANLPKPDIPPSAPVLPDEMEPSEQIEQLHAAIWEKMEAVRELRTKLRMECVPSTVCTYLAQCLKETDVETQKITSQKEYFERSISELDCDLHEAVESADTTEQDAKRIWKRIQLLKSHSTVALRDMEMHDADDDESSKWNWYIS